MIKELALKEKRIKRREREVEGGNNKKRIRACSVVLCLLHCLLYKFYQAASILLHSFPEAGDSFVLAGKDVMKMHPYP